MSGNLFVITAPSGAGKTSMVRELLSADSNIQLSISYTTRPPRPGEVNGTDYHFISEDTFLSMLEKGEFLESAEVYGNRYGTSHTWISQKMESGTDILLEIDWQGAAQVRKIFPETLGIFILPPSLEALRDRLKNRSQDSAEVIERRMQAAREDISHVGEFDYVIINNDFKAAVQDLLAVVRASRLTTRKQLARHSNLLTQLK
ncbi:guanylate kinase [Sulfurirhabdus autotrophica]|uniref:Guanylate kinase n=1 Tax=Sulfurirhabdus autotrophica TaxID=1706046 RepID=A0A4R3Y0H0_9PROT|nr:guanylate kinase [Sulfurirhabdus autotrophica]TCV84118.1 guanylate kinase [Sulfurirhabdus autotrophica]